MIGSMPVDEGELMPVKPVKAVSRPSLGWFGFAIAGRRKPLILIGFPVRLASERGLVRH